MTNPLKAYALVTVLLWPLTLSVGVAADTPADAPAAVVTPGTDVRNIIEAVSRKTHKNFLLDPRVRANINLVGVEVGEVTYPLLLTILAVHGYSTYEQDGVVVVVPESNARQDPSRVVSPDDLHAPDAEVITVILPVGNSIAGLLVPVLRPLMPQSAQLVALVDRNALIAVDRASNVRRLAAMIADINKLPPVKIPWEQAPAGE
jgi:general secretion pathway protein D